MSATTLKYQTLLDCMALTGSDGALEKDRRMSATLQDECDVLVIGSGLTGLTSAVLLHEAGHTVILVEAAERLGGRVHSLRDRVSNGYLADLGPTWIWPQAQPVATRWLRELNLELMPQFEKGDAIIDLATDAAPTRHQLPGMDDSYRVVGGTTTIVEQMARRLPNATIVTRTRVNRISCETGSIKVSTDNASLSVIHPRRVVVATPLRVAVSSIIWSPALDSRLARLMESTPTWMAAQAKAVAIYNEPFWRARGLSGRIASRIGPLVDAHDHSGAQGTPAALFGFIGWHRQLRHTNLDALKSAVIEQLVRCFGEDARTPEYLYIEDWAENESICAPRDLTELPQHPQLAPSVLRQPIWADRVFLAIAELATISPGLIEGAFHIGSEVAKKVSATLR